jgi:hypothetical protein
MTDFDVYEKRWYVDIPDEESLGDPDIPFRNVGIFSTKQEAIVFAKENFGSDDNGNISLVSCG